MMKFIADMLAFEDTVAEVHCFFLKGAKNIGTTNAYDAAMKYKLFPVKHQ